MIQLIKNIKKIEVLNVISSHDLIFCINYEIIREIARKWHKLNWMNMKYKNKFKYYNLLRKIVSTTVLTNLLK